MNFFEFLEKFPTEQAVIDYFIKIRYNNEVSCPHCGSIKVHHRKDHPKLFQCADCHNHFSIFKNTIFEKTTTDLRKWMYAIHLFLNGKKGISGLQLQREIKVTYKTAWRMLKQIREAMGNKENQEFINTIIEIDETYVGGKPNKRNKKDKDDSDKGSSGGFKRGRGTNKKPVVGVVDRLNKQIHCKVAFPNTKGKCLSGKQLLEILNQVCKRENVIMTDEFKGYNILKGTEHIHLRVNHSMGEYANGEVHTNTIESFWATLKRGILGIYHHTSVKYLQNYVDEFCFRYNNRGNDGVFDLVLRQAIL